ncbi:MAG TPA: hypothetical protein PKD72_15955, partial [Gemmatales bacterium]|nr:hypothetical protein [Gemmatales bacterium]
MLPCLSSVTTLPATLAEDITACGDANCNYLEVWLTKLETYLQGNGAWAKPEAVKALLAERNVKIISAAYQGGLLLSHGEGRKVAFDQFQKRLSLCQEFEIGPLLIVPAPADKLEP